MILNMLYCGTPQGEVVEESRRLETIKVLLLEVSCMEQSGVVPPMFLLLLLRGTLQWHTLAQEAWGL